MTVKTESFDKADSAGWGPDQTWTTDTGSPSTISNRGACASNGNHYMRVAASGIGADQYVQLEQIGSGRLQAANARVTDANNWYQVQNNNAGPDKLAIRKRVGGTISLLATGTTTLVSGDVLRIEVEGQTIRGYINGNLEVTVATDTAHASGDVGAYVNRGAHPIDNWEAGDLGGAVVVAVPQYVRRTHMVGNVHR